MPTSDFILELARCVERLADVLLAGVAIWLGYKLYSKAVVELSDAEFSKGGFLVKLKRVGPGTLFAFFGCVIVSYSIAHPLEITSPPSGGSGPLNSSTTKYAVEHGLSPNTDIEFARYLDAINTVARYAMLDRMPNQPTEKASYSAAIQSLLEARFVFVETLHGKEAVDKWKNWSRAIPNDPAFVSKLSPTDQSLYASLAVLFNAH